MSFSIALHSTPRRAVIRFSGLITPLQVRDACLRLLDHPGWEPGTPQVWDFSATTHTIMDVDDWSTLLAASRANRTRLGDDCVAVVSSDPELEDLLTEYAHVFRRSGRTFRFAETSEAAYSWLEAHLEVEPEG